MRFFTTSRVRLLTATIAAVASLSVVAFPNESLAMEEEDPLLEYVRRPDKSFSFSKESVHLIGSEAHAHILRLVSQQWHGTEWQHRLIVITPPQIKHPETALLIITGGSNQKERPFDPSRVELELATQMAETFGMAVAIVEQVPNQPLIGGLYEDDLIAYTFSQRLETGGRDWPLLFPMVKSATRAMDAVTEFLAETHGTGPSKFIVTGASKRGWTTWLAAAVDDRVSAIAPMVFDIVNFRPQLAQQREYFHGYSPEIRAYEERDLFSLLESKEGAALADTMDPFSYRQKLDMPKLILLGTNDPYWTVNAANLYFSDLPGENRLFYAANTGHGLGKTVFPTLLAFVNAQLNDETLPALQWHRNSHALEVTWEKPAADAWLWTAEAPTRNFRKSEWVREKLPGNQNASIRLDSPKTGFTARFVEVRFPGPVGSYGLSTEIQLSGQEAPEN